MTVVLDLITSLLEGGGVGPNIGMQAAQHYIEKLPLGAYGPVCFQIHRDPFDLVEEFCHGACLGQRVQLGLELADLGEVRSPYPFSSSSQMAWLLAR